MVWQGITLHAKLEPQQPARGDATAKLKGRSGNARPRERAPDARPGQRRGSEKICFVETVRRDGSKQRLARIAGSKPLGRHPGEELSAEKRSSLREAFGNKLNAAPPGSKKAMELRFRIMLLDRGDYVGGINPKTLHCRNDGNVYNYPRYFCKLYDAGVARSEAALVRENRPAALEAARALAEEAAVSQRVRGVPYADLSHAKRSRLVERLCCNFMHGFDDFVKCLESERQASADQEPCQEPCQEACQKACPSPRSPSYDY